MRPIFKNKNYNESIVKYVYKRHKLSSATLGKTCVPFRYWPGLMKLDVRKKDNEEQTILIYG